MFSEVFTKKKRAGFAGLLLLSLTVLMFMRPQSARAQFVLCAAAPGSLTGQPYITVNLDQDPLTGINVRGGPNSYLYDKVGKLYPGESALALGRTSGGDWIQIACPGVPGGTGWVYTANVTLTSTGFLPEVPLPPPPVFPLSHDPTLAASLEVQPTATRLPTYTPPPPPPTLPAYADLPRSSPSSWTAPLAAGFALAGVFGLLASLFFRS